RPLRWPRMGQGVHACHDRVGGKEAVPGGPSAGERGQAANMSVYRWAITRTSTKGGAECQAAQGVTCSRLGAEDLPVGECDRRQADSGWRQREESLDVVLAGSLGVALLIASFAERTWLS